MKNGRTIIGNRLGSWIPRYHKLYLRRSFDEVAQDAYQPLFGTVIAVPWLYPQSWQNYILTQEHNFKGKRVFICNVDLSYHRFLWLFILIHIDRIIKSKLMLDDDDYYNDYITATFTTTITTFFTSFGYRFSK